MNAFRDYEQGLEERREVRRLRLAEKRGEQQTACSCSCPCKQDEALTTELDEQDTE